MGKYLDVAASVKSQPTLAPSEPVKPESKGKTVIDGRIAVEVVHRSDNMIWFVDRDGLHWRYFPRLHRSFPITVVEKSVPTSDPTTPSPAVK